MISYYKMSDSSINAELKLENTNDDKSWYGVLAVALAYFNRIITVLVFRNMSDLHSSAEHTQGKILSGYFELTQIPAWNLHRTNMK